MYAVIQTGGKQYSVTPGASVQVETLPGEPGAAISFDNVLAFFSDDGSVRAGQDAAGVRVNATIQGQGRAPKVIVFKFKRKKQYKKTIGHRQNFTRVMIDGIEG